MLPGKGLLSCSAAAHSVFCFIFPSLFTKGKNTLMVLKAKLQLNFCIPCNCSVTESRRKTFQLSLADHAHCEFLFAKVWKFPQDVVLVLCDCVYIRSKPPSNKYPAFINSLPHATSTPGQRNCLKPERSICFSRFSLLRLSKDEWGDLLLLFLLLLTLTIIAWQLNRDLPNLYHTNHFSVSFPDYSLPN